MNVSRCSKHTEIEGGGGNSSKLPQCLQSYSPLNSSS